MKFYQNLNDCLFFEPYPSDINNLSITVLLELYHGCVCVCVFISMIPNLRLYGSIFLSSTIEILLGLQYIRTGLWWRPCQTKYGGGINLTQPNPCQFDTWFICLLWNPPPSPTPHIPPFFELSTFYIKGTVQRDFRPPVFSAFEPAWATDSVLFILSSRMLQTVTDLEHPG